MPHRRWAIAAVGMAAMLAFSATTDAGTKLFSSAAGSTVIWTTAGNWSPAFVPTATDDVALDYTNEVGTKTITLGLNAAGSVANSLTFGGSTTHGALAAFELRANSSSSPTARTLTLGTAGQTNAGNITVEANVTGTQSVGITSVFWGVLNITVASGVGGFTIANNSATQTLDLAGNLVEGVSTGSTLSLASAGGLIRLSGGNTYTGATTITGGTVEAAGAGALGKATTGTASISVSAGGTLVLSDTTLTDRVKNTATLTLGAGSGVASSGGKLALGKSADTANTSETIGALTLNKNATIDFASTAGSHFALTSSATSTLSATSADYVLVLNWDGTAKTLGVTGSADRLIFAAGVTGFSAGQTTNQIRFNIGGVLYDTQFLASGGGLEAVANDPIAVPEPSTWAADALTLAAVAFMHRRRVRKLIGALRA